MEQPRQLPPVARDGALRRMSTRQRAYLGEPLRATTPEPVASMKVWTSLQNRRARMPSETSIRRTAHTRTRSTEAIQAHRHPAENGTVRLARSGRTAHGAAVTRNPMKLFSPEVFRPERKKTRLLPATMRLRLRAGDPPGWSSVPARRVECTQPGRGGRTIRERRTGSM